jgi:hypothetical protein
VCIRVRLAAPATRICAFLTSNAFAESSSRALHLATLHARASPTLRITSMLYCFVANTFANVAVE